MAINVNNERKEISIFHLNDQNERKKNENRLKCHFPFSITLKFRLRTCSSKTMSSAIDHAIVWSSFVAQWKFSLPFFLRHWLQMDYVSPVSFKSRHEFHPFDDRCHKMKQASSLRQQQSKFGSRTKSLLETHSSLPLSHIQTIQRQTKAISLKVYNFLVFDHFRFFFICFLFFSLHLMLVRLPKTTEKIESNFRCAFRMLFVHMYNRVFSLSIRSIDIGSRLEFEVRVAVKSLSQ